MGEGGGGGGGGGENSHFLLINNNVVFAKRSFAQFSYNNVYTTHS